MATKTSWVNDDGLVIYFGVRDVEDKRPGVIADNNEYKTLVLDFTYDDLPVAVASDAGVNYIPAGATVIDAVLRVTTAWVGGTSLAIGTEELDGSDIDADGLVTAAAGATANLTLGTALTGTGADIGEAPHATVDSYILGVTIGTFTAGAASLVVRYSE